LKKLKLKIKNNNKREWEGHFLFSYFLPNKIHILKYKKESRTANPNSPLEIMSFANMSLSLYHRQMNYAIEKQNY